MAETERAWRALGKILYGPLEEEKKSLIFRRTLYVAKDMKAGDIFTKESLRSIRPGYGLPTKYHALLLGKAIKRDTPKGTAVTWDLIL